MLLYILSLIFVFLLMGLKKFKSYSILPFPAILMTLYFLLSTSCFSFGFNVPIFEIYELDDNAYLTLASIVAFFSSILFVFYVFNFNNYAIGKINKAFDGGYVFSIKAFPSLLIFISVVCQLVLVLSVSPSSSFDFIIRNYTFFEVDKNVMVFIDIVFWLHLLLIPFIKNDFLRRSTLFLYSLLFVGLGERQVFVLLFVYPLVRYAFFLCSKKVVFFYLFLSVVMLVGIVSVRYDGVSSGVLGVIYSILDFHRFLNYFELSINYVLNFSIFSTSKGIGAIDIKYDYISYSINPLPSWLFNHEYGEVINLQPHVPLTGFAVLISFLGFWGPALIGFYLAVLVVLFQKLFIRKNMPLVFIFVIFYASFVFWSQYSLRSGMRFFYYLLFLYVIYFWSRHIFTTLLKNR